MTALDFDRLATLPFKKFVITYAGSNDEGYVNEVSGQIEDGVELAVSYELQHELEDVAYDILEKHYAGWEINEGSHGHITIDVAARSAFLHHGTIVETTEWEDTVLA